MGSGASVPAQVRGGAGYRVMGVEEGGPCARALSFPDAASARRGVRDLREASLVPWLDFVVSVNGRELGGEDGDDVLEEELGGGEGGKGGGGGGGGGDDEPTPVILEVWNVKRRALRTVQVSLPRGSGSRLGLHVQRAAIPPGGLEAGSMGGGSGAEAADGSAGAEAVLHVTGVEPGSPAAAVGLVPDDDYVLASLQGGAYEDVESFGDDVGDALLKFQAAAAAGSGSGDGGPGAGAGAGAGVPAVLLPLFVYRTSTDSVRLVQLPVRDAAWGAGGTSRGLGLELSFGKFHELPAVALTTDGRPEFEVARASSGSAEAPSPQPQLLAHFVAATVAAADAPPAVPPPPPTPPAAQPAAPTAPLRAVAAQPVLTPFGSTAPQRSLAAPAVLMQARGSAHLHAGANST